MYDVKTIHASENTYKNAHLRVGERCKSAKVRADRVPQEYAAHADKIDVHNRRVGFHPPGVPRWDGAPPGPVRRLLDTFQPVRGLCFGAYAETSPAVDKLLKAVAGTCLSQDVAGAWGAVRQGGQGALRLLPTTQPGCLRLSAMRENARLVLYRVEALSAPLGACTGGLADRTEWQRRQYVRSAVAYDALSGPCACRGDSQGWRSTLRFAHVEMGRAA